MFDKQDLQHLALLLLISKMINLANDVSHDQAVLTAKIFGAMATQHILTINCYICELVKCTYVCMHTYIVRESERESEREREREREIASLCVHIFRYL